MHLEGSHVLKAPLTTVWQSLLDPVVLAKVTPGVKTLEHLGNEEYKALFEIKMGPVKGEFNGTLAVVDKVELERFSLKIKVTGKIGNVNADGYLNLKERSATETEVAFSGDARLSGTLARTGQRVLSGVANTMTNQFFAAIEQEISGPSAGRATRITLWQKIKAFFAGLFRRRK